MISVVVADDHAIVRAGVRALLGAEPDVTVLAEAENGHQAVAAVERCSPDVLLLDLSMSHANGLEAIWQVRRKKPGTRVLVLSMHETAEYVGPALRAGAHGYVVKGAGLQDLVRALRAVAAGERYLAEGAERFLLESADRSDISKLLTPREREVLQRVAEGQTNRQIASELGLSPKTVDTHRSSLMRKLDLHDVQALTRFAMRHGLLGRE